MKRILQLCCLTAVFTFASSELWAQERTVSGKVTSVEDGLPLPGVNIVLKGTTNGTVTDIGGNYSLSVPPEGGILVYTFIGLKSQEQEVGTRNVLDISMATDAKQLAEVIVIAGALGLERQAKELGYAASTVSAGTLTQAKATDIAQSLNGKVSGVNITSTNTSVFSNSKISIRGIRSLTGNNQPMLVMDGAQVPLNVLYAISPEDIAEMTVLKSGASAALYGPDAVNGVIVLTTKRGKSNQAPTISVTSAYQATRVAFFPKLQHSFGAGAGEIQDKYGNLGYVPYENQMYGPRYDGTIKDIGIRLEDGSIQSGPYSPIHKNDKIKFWNTGSTFQNTISLSGSDYFLSFQDVQIKGLMPNDKNRRTTVRFNGNKKINKLSVSYGMGYTLQNSDVVNENQLPNLYSSGSYSGSIMFAVMQTPDNVPLLAYKDRNNKFGQYSNYYNEFAFNPYWVIDNLRSKSKSSNFIGNATLGYEIAPWLKATARLNATVNEVRTDNTQNPLVVSDWAINVAHRNATQYFNAKGAVFNDMFRTALLNVDYFLDGKANITNGLTVSYVAGGNYRQQTDRDVAIGGNNLVVPYLNNVSVRSGDATVPGYGNGLLIPYNSAVDFNYTLMTKRVSAYGTLGFGFKDWAFLEFTGRNDWDSRLPAANRSFFYPSVNASVVLSDAISALKDTELSYLKLRAAYSQSANVNLSPYSLTSTYSPAVGFPFGSNVGFTANNTIPDPNLKPETVTSQEVGFEIGFLNGKYDLEATYFDQQCDDQVVQTTLPFSTGYSFGLANAASFENKGIEMDFGMAPYKIGKGAISFRINATYNTNEVTATPGKLPVPIGGTLNFTQTGGSSPTVSNIAVVGGPAFQFQITDYERDPATGKVIVNRVTGYPSQATAPIITGRSIPLWVVGFTPTYSIGGFSFAMTWDYKTGHQFYSGMGSDLDFAGISGRSASYGRMRFVMPNSVYKNDDGKYVENTNIQVQDGNYNFWSTATTNTAIGTNYFASATAFRLREVNITYNLPKNWLAGVKFIKKASLSLIGRNLLMYVPKSNQWGDPEFNFNSAGNTFGLGSSYQTPSSRLYGGSLNITL